MSKGRAAHALGDPLCLEPRKAEGWQMGLEGEARQEE